MNARATQEDTDHSEEAMKQSSRAVEQKRSGRVMLYPARFFLGQPLAGLTASWSKHNEAEIWVWPRGKTRFVALRDKGREEFRPDYSRDADTSTNHQPGVVEGIFHAR